MHIRPVGVLDAEHVLDWENNVPDWNTAENDVPYTVLDILNFIHELDDIEKVKQARWIICKNDGHAQIGAVDLTEIDFQKSEASVGVLVAHQANRGKGYAKQALQLLEREAKSLGITRLISTILPNNEVSIHLFQKCGFTKIGETDERFLIDGAYIQALVFEKWLKE